MRIAVFGAGAVGGYVAAKLALAGRPVSVVARGPQLAALRARGLTLIEGGVSRRVEVAARDRAAALGEQDLVILTLKAHSIPAAAPEIAALLGPRTVLLSAQNGIPWWYFHQEGGALEGARIEAVDPGGTLFAALDPDRVVGCVLHMATSVPEPGVVRHQAGGRFILGELDGTVSERLQRVFAVLSDAGLAAETTTEIRREIWFKLWGNVAFNPLSVLTAATLDRMIADPAIRRLAVEIMNETETVAGRLGLRFDMSVEERVEVVRRLGAFKTSMLQDLEAGRPLEIEALMGAVVEIGRRLDCPTPMTEAVAALTRLRGAR